MNLFLPAHQEVLEVLSQHDVEFIVIGGYAVIYHGYHRTTGDVDIWLKPTNANKKNFIKAMTAYGIEDETLTKIDLFDFETHLMFSLGKEPEKIEFLTFINGVNYDDADKEKIKVTMDNVTIPFLHFNHLILSKMTTGRIKDLADIEELQKIQKHKLR